MILTKDMQEYEFIPNIGMEAKAFWDECKRFVQEHRMDKILAYMYLMLKKPNAKNLYN